ncbi:autotransporter-associated beta strand repeat-containing protein, partial [Mesorhizobium sp.]|uniref:autotransporter-associated beta strand repeat-containing protein n=1 Tax=Mesorhizobium sp. TaxID=1871066 RepID=UPI0025DF6AB3
MIDGGDGVWDATNRNWTEADGAINGKWGQDFAVFAGQAGTVTVDDSAGTVGFTGMQFMTDGYVIDGDTLTTNTAATRIRTDAGVTAAIAAQIAGSGGLVKTDTGTLVLSGANTYSGGTTISTGTLIGQAASFGTGDIVDNAALVF